MKLYTLLFTTTTPIFVPTDESDYMSFSDRVVGTVSNNNRETCFVVEVINDEIIEQSEETFSLVLSVEVRVFNNIIITASKKPLQSTRDKIDQCKMLSNFCVTNNLWHTHGT